MTDDPTWENDYGAHQQEARFQRATKKLSALGGAYQRQPSISKTGKVTKAPVPAEKKSTGLAALFDLGDLRRGMEKGLDHAKKKIAYRKGLNVERRVAPRDGDIDGSFDEHTGERVKDYGG